MRSPENLWRSPWRFLLLPVGLVFACIVQLRRILYRCGFLNTARLSVPVLIVGNITAGGSGKTPLVAALAEQLSARGFHPGIISRGYGGTAASPVQVDEESPPGIVGDEPVLLRKKGFPVWVGRKRVEAAWKLLEAEPQCNLLISDDGLQHYALPRNFEIAVIDAKKGFGNGLPLPAGPLREPPSRLKSVDAIVVNGSKSDFLPANQVPAFFMQLSGSRFFSLERPELSADAAFFSGKRIHAIAGIGNPARFFDHLSSLKLEFVAHPFPDHHPYVPEDLEFDDCDIILMTEKDAIKCTGFAPGKCWFLQVNAEIDPALVELIVQTLGKTDGS